MSSCEYCSSRPKLAEIHGRTIRNYELKPTAGYIQY